MKKMEVLILILISILLGVFGQLSLKQGMKNVGNFELKDFISSKIFSLITEKFVVVGVAMYAIATLLWLTILSKAELSFAYPMLAIGYVLIAIFSKLFFNENVTALRFLAVILISVGIFLLLKS